MPREVDFVVVTPLTEERDAVLMRLPGYRQLPPAEQDIRVYYEAELPVTFSNGGAATYSIVVMPLAKMGHTEAATATSDAIRRFRPRYVLLVGIAGGIAKADVNLGDVLIADQVADFELAKITSKKSEIRWQVHEVDQRLLLASKNFTSEDWYRTQAPRPNKRRPGVLHGPICTSNKVIADESLSAQLRDVWVKLIGVEMEASGVANAASQSARKPGFFMVRGASDLADADKDSGGVTRWRAYACEVAAAWTIDFLKSGPAPPSRKRESTKRVRTTQITVRSA